MVAEPITVEGPPDSYVLSFEEWIDIGYRMGYLTHALATFTLEVAPRTGPQV